MPFVYKLMTFSKLLSCNNRNQNIICYQVHCGLPCRSDTVINKLIVVADLEQKQEEFKCSNLCFYICQELLAKKADISWVEDLFAQWDIPGDLAKKLAELEEGLNHLRESKAKVGFNDSHARDNKIVQINFTFVIMLSFLLISVTLLFVICCGINNLIFFYLDH